MLSGATGARAVAANQGVFTGQFDDDMNQRHLIGGKSNLHQFDLFQMALSNATVKVCKSAYTKDMQHVIDNLEEVVIKEPDEPDDALLAGSKAFIHLTRYTYQYERVKERKACYLSNKARMCSVVRAQCDPAMEAKLEATEGWEDNKTDLLFVLTAAQAACISVQRNYSFYVSARGAMHSLANCFQNAESALDFNKNYLACKKLCDKAGIGPTFSKKFLDLEKKKNSKLEDTAAMKVAQERFRGTMWLLNSEVPSTVTNNLVQNHIVGIHNYPENVEQAFTMLSFTEQETSTVTSLAQTYEPGWCETGDRSRGGRGGRDGRGGPGRGAGRGGGRRPNGKKPMP